MKKKYSVVAGCFCTTLLMAQQGTFNVTLKSIKCIKETADDIFDLDGKKDEVYGMLYYSVQQQTGNYSQHVGTEVYGDMNGFSDFSFHRQKGGSAGNTGGLKAGDEIIINKSLIGAHIADNTTITLIPTVWEWDNKSSTLAFGNFSNAMKSAFAIIDPQSLVLIQQIDKNMPSSVIAGYARNWNIFSSQPSFSNVLQVVNGKPGDRPIGMNSFGEFYPKVLILNNKLLGLTNRTGAYDAANLEVVRTVEFIYDEEALANTRDHGIYAITLRVTWVPDPVKQTAPPPPPLNNYGIKAPGTIQTNNTTLKVPPTPIDNAILSGAWQGTISSQTNAKDGPFNFKFNNNVFWVLNNNGSGSAIYSGGYKIANGNFSASYLDGNNYTMVINSTDYYAATKEMTGNFTCTGPNYYKTGKWVAKKISN